MKKTILIFIIMLAICVVATPVQANYQANNGAKVFSYYGNSCTNAIRNMEGSGQVMGLTETHNDTTLKATSASNNIDVHQMKGTEWGAVALLSASQDYGKKGTGTARYVVGGSGLQTTTGNVYGMYLTSDRGTWLAYGGTGYISNSVDSRYVNRYGDANVGAAILNWHNKKYANYRTDVSSYGLNRGGAGLFCYGVSNSSDSYVRAVAVCGQGF